jgi:hypothetical protein
VLRIARPNTNRRMSRAKRIRQSTRRRITRAADGTRALECMTAGAMPR